MPPPPPPIIDLPTPLDASDHILSATLNQQGRPVAFFSRTLSGPELKHSSVEKEAAAIVEAVRKWKHYLNGKHFKLITDQKSVAYMFDTKRHSKIKSDKVTRWRIELSMYDFDIVYRAREENIPADALSRVKIMSLTIDKLYELHKSLCHPGVARMAHFVKSQNLLFLVEDVKRITQACKECEECKPQYYSPEPSHLIKATQPFERLNLDFKGPLPSNDRCRCRHKKSFNIVLRVWYAYIYSYRSWLGIYEFRVKEFPTAERHLIQ